MTGHDAASFVSRPSLLSEIIADEDRPRWDAHRDRAAAGVAPTKLEFRIRTLGGETGWIDHVCTRVLAADGRDLGIRGSNRDITQRKRAENDLRTAFEEIERLKDRLEA